ncbi:YbaK/EbsC family protein [Pseudorhodobacter sp.]|uniref:YbaK/EbsC family protein n=1 Tax=Pseudorhodobacter sp. TaxID=1934400 RepID=UPI002AFEC4E5|nr:YbaK/EbsC family protein [Pseudorhodobacter sp.]
MSKSLRRVRAALEASGVAFAVQEMQAETRTAPQAALAVGCALDQIVKSLLFCGQNSGRLALFLVAGGNQLSEAKAALALQEPLSRADAPMVRAITGFAIGGVAPIGHLTELPVFMDPALMAFDTVWAAAGTPNHVFSIAPPALLQISKARLTEFIDY